MRSAILLLLFFALTTAHAQTKIAISIDATHVTNRIQPKEAIGGALDGHWGGETDRILQPANIAAMRGTGLQPISYRLRTELGGEAWHWNPAGHWSEAKQQQGYWTSDSTDGAPIQISYGYFLPRRGNTHDNANDNGYSRIDDGDTATFWKSNPYLDHRFTGEADSLHPQWIVIDLGRARPVNTLRIQWADPYALSFRLDYADDIGDDYFDPHKPDLWHPLTSYTNPAGGMQSITFAQKPLLLRFLRISMNQSSYTGPQSNDIRDRLGFAIREVQLGILDEKNIFKDFMYHRPSNSQSVIRVSSTDPWHRATDRDPNTEQAGLDRFFSCGITGRLPAMLPMAVLYDTPENMSALLHYVHQKNYPVSELEMGEEAEGQLVHPTDYASLYLQFASVLKRAWPGIKMGGPGFAGLAKDGPEDTTTFSERQWMMLFLSYLKQHGRLDDFNFFSFEWYPFDDVCAPPAGQLAQEPQLMRAALDPFFKDILPRGLPLYITEYGYSAYGGRAEVTIEGALLYADILGQFLTLGGQKSFLYGLEPTDPEQTNQCDWGNDMLFGMGSDGGIAYRTAAYYTVQMMTHQWAGDSSSLLELYNVTTSDPLITAYALQRPDGGWSLALLNKDPKHSKLAQVTLHTDPGQHRLKMETSALQYSSARYHWKSAGPDGHPDKELPPVTVQVANGNLSLPPYSLTIVHGR